MAQGIKENIKVGADIVGYGAGRVLAVMDNIEKKLGVKNASIAIQGIDKLGTFLMGFHKSALDMKADYSKATDVLIASTEKLATSMAKDFMVGESPDAKKDGNGLAGSQAPGLATPESGGAVIAAANAGAEQNENTAKKSADKQLNVDKKQSDTSAELVKKEWDKKLNYAGKGAASMANIMQNLYVMTGSKSRAMFGAMKAFAIAETVIQTYRAAQGAYAAMSKIHPALGIAAAAAAVASGLARVAAIKNTKPSGATATINNKGKANPSYSGGSTNAYPVPQRQEQTLPTQSITVIIHNPLSQQNWAEIAESEIIPAINDAVENRNIELTVETVN